LSKAAVRIDEPGIGGFLHQSESPNGDGLVLTHGAGANCQAPLLRALADAFCAARFTVLRYDLPFRQLRPHGPPLRGSDKRDREGILRAIEVMKTRTSGRIFAGGHSYGGRQTTMLASERPEIAAGLLLLSYPLHPPKKPDQLRISHFGDLQTPSLFVSGSRDGFATTAEMESALKLVPARTQLLTVEGAGHDLMSKKNAEELPRKIVEAFAAMFEARNQ